MIHTRDHLLAHGITLNCRSAGSPGRPVLLFLHGFPEAAFVWDTLLLHFSRPEHGGYHCVAPNLRGYAGSSAPAEVAAYRAKHLVQDIAALIADVCGQAGQLACLVAHDWGGAVAWNLAAARPDLLARLAIINSPHPATFLRALQHSPAQQAASAYMNFLVRPDAEALLAEHDYRRLWALFTGMGAVDGPNSWLTEPLKKKYRSLWQAGLSGPLNYYRASPLRPPSQHDPAAAAVTLPPDLVKVNLPTLVLWGMGDTALLPELLEGLPAFVPHLKIERLEHATHWVVHEKPTLIAARLAAFLG